MKRRRLARLVEQIADQPGVTCRPTQEGWFFMLPNGRGTSLHRTPSDRHAMKNFESTLRQAGVVWPGGK